MARPIGASESVRPARGRSTSKSGSGETISLRPRSQPETNPVANGLSNKGVGHVDIHTQRLLPPSLQAIPDCHAAASLGLTAMITPLNVVIYTLGGFMLFALAIGLFAAPV
jgi:hypothetical protein